jgi:hypothetical protein
MKKSFVLFCLIFFLFLIAPGSDQEYVAQAEIDEDFDLDTAKILSISPSTLKPQDYLYAGLNWYASVAECYFDTGFPNSIFVIAPVYLPQGAVVTKLTVFYTDNGDGADEAIAVSLTRHEMISGLIDALASVTTDGAGYPSQPYRRILKDKTINYPLVQNHLYSYTLNVRFYQGSDKVKFHGAKIVYE